MFSNLLSLWIIHWQFVTFDRSNCFSFSTQFPPISTTNLHTARALVQRRLRTGTVCLQCLLWSHRGHRVDGWGRSCFVMTWYDALPKLGGTKTYEQVKNFVKLYGMVWVGKLFLLMFSCFWCMMEMNVLADDFRFWLWCVLSGDFRCFSITRGWTFCWHLLVIQHFSWNVSQTVLGFFIFLPHGWLEDFVVFSVLSHGGRNVYIYIYVFIYMIVLSTISRPSIIFYHLIMLKNPHSDYLNLKS